MRCHDSFNSCIPALRALLAGAALLGAALAQAAPGVTVSIKPLELLAAPVTRGISAPTLLLRQDQDPHHLALRPTERRALADADLVLWIGPMLEVPLAKVLDERQAPQIAVQALSGLELLSSGAGPDPHVWLDTRNARLIAAVLAQRLGELDPDNASVYARNSAEFDAQLDALDAEIGMLFAGLEQRAWAVYHHSLRYFQQQYGLRDPLTLTDSENNAPGVRSVVAARERLARDGIDCLLIEPGVNEAHVRNLLSPALPRLVPVDLLGHTSGAADQGYVTMLRTLAESLSNCLRG